jgi:glycosyltransferase involved in cell wall biosynthesis
MEIPLVSVVTITYKHEQYILDTVKGVLNQETDFEVEYIIADDCSPDDTQKVVSEFLENHPKAAWVKYTRHEENKGMNPNFVWALNQCRGKYIALCEGDDYWTDPLKLQKQVDHLEKNQHVVVVYQPWVNLRDGKFSDIQSSFPATLGVVFRMRSDLLKYYPENILNGDTALLFFLSFYGIKECIYDLKPAVKRKDSGGVWNSLDFLNQEENRIKTWSALLIATKGTRYNYQAKKKLASQILVSGRKIQEKKISHALSTELGRLSYAQAKNVLLEYLKQLITHKFRGYFK